MAVCERPGKVGHIGQGAEYMALKDTGMSTHRQRLSQSGHVFSKDNANTESKSVPTHAVGNDLEGV